MSVVVGAAVGFSDVKVVVDGRIFAAGAPRDGESAQFDSGTSESPGGAVDYTEDTIRIPGHGYTTGDRIVYHVDAEAGAESALGGLEDGETYVVLVVDDDTIRLAKFGSIDLRPEEAKSTSQHRLVSPRSTAFVLNAVDEEADAIWLPGHRFADGDVVTYSHDSDFGAIEGLVNGNEYVVEVDGDRIRLRSVTAPRGAPPIVLSQGNALGTHSFTTLDGTAYDLELGRIDADSDTVHVENHGFGSALDGLGGYQRGGDAGLPQLLGGATYEFELVDDHSFRFRDPATGLIVDLTDDGASSAHEIGFVDTDTQKTFRPDSATVDGDRDTIRIENHGFETGDVVFYGTDPDAVTLKDAPVVDTEAPGLLMTAATIVPDPTIGGLSGGAPYRVVVVDDHTIRLVAFHRSAEDARAIDLSQGAAQGEEADLDPTQRIVHLLKKPKPTPMGINISANLLGIHVITATVQQGGIGFMSLSPLVNMCRPIDPSRWS